MTCDRCGKDTGTDGVCTVELCKTRHGAIEHITVRECRACALAQAREEETHADHTR